MTTTVRTIKEKLPAVIEKRVIKTQFEIRAKRLTYTELLTNYNRYNENYIISIMENNGDTIQNLINKEAYAREAERVAKL